MAKDQQNREFFTYRIYKNEDKIISNRLASELIRKRKKGEEKISSKQETLALIIRESEE